MFKNNFEIEKEEQCQIFPHYFLIFAAQEKLIFHARGSKDLSQKRAALQSPPGRNRLTLMIFDESFAPSITVCLVLTRENAMSAANHPTANGWMLIGAW
jgi:hypothetical protein